MFGQVAAPASYSEHQQYRIVASLATIECGSCRAKFAPAFLPSQVTAFAVDSDCKEHITVVGVN